MLPYTTVNRNRNDEDLRRNWRGNKNYHRKKVSRPFKKIKRRESKRMIQEQLDREQEFFFLAS